MSSDLARRIGFTIGALLVFRLGTHVPLPGFDPRAWDWIFHQQSSGILGIFNVFAGGAIGRLAIFALGITPYLSAAIILQLASMALPSLRALPKRGESGRRRLDVYTLALTVLLAVVQSFGVAVGLESVPNLVVDAGLPFRLTTMCSLTGGVVFLVWLAGQITARGIGNGLALILAVGLVAELPSAIADTLELARRGILSDNAIAGLFLLALALAAVVVHMELARRRLVIAFPARQIGMRPIESQGRLQLKLNSAGIIPLILASWLALLLLWAASLFGGEGPDSVASHLQIGRPLYLVLYGAAILGFTFFYTAFLLDPDEIAQELKQHGGMIAGIEPGPLTADHIDHVVSRISVIGAGYLLLVAVIPEILVAKMQVPFYLGGTSLLIVICAILDVKAQLEGARHEGLEAA